MIDQHHCFIDHSSRFWWISLIKDRYDVAELHCKVCGVIGVIGLDAKVITERQDFYASGKVYKESEHSEAEAPMGNSIRISKVQRGK